MSRFYKKPKPYSREAVSYQGGFLVRKEKMERRIESSKLRNGNVLRAYCVFNNSNGEPIREQQDLWIRKGTRVPLVDKVLTLEDFTGRIMEVPVLDILEGRHGELVFEGAYSPRRLGLTDPREVRARLNGRRTSNGKH